MKIVIFVGGRGTRLWPLSRVSKPKSFIPLVNGQSIFQITYNRYKKAYKPKDIFITTEEAYVPFIKEQAPPVPDNNIIKEPERKDLLAACGLATAVVNKYFPGETILISWAKHFISKESVFLDALEAASQYAKESEKIVSVDAKAEYPSVHNGWVHIGKKLANKNGFDVMLIDKHIEKPKEHVAKKLFESNEWLINTGYRIWKADTMLDYYKKYQPDMYKGLMKIVGDWGTSKQNSTLKKEYGKLKKDSIEYGIFEKLPADVRATIPADMGWVESVMTWQTFYKSLITPKKKTIVDGGADTVFIDSDKNLIIGPKGKMISIIGISNVAVIDTPDGLLVCDMNKTEKVKDLYTKLEKYHKKYIK